MILFGQTDTVFTSNGDKVLQPLKAKIRKEDNGTFYLDTEFGLEYVNDVTEGRIIVAETPQGKQPFRVGNVKKTRKKLSAKCLHVFFDTRNYLIADSYVVDKNCNAALDHLNDATEPQSAFSTISDVTTVSSYRCVRKSLYEAIMTVVERWGGHLRRDGFQIGVMDSIGQDNGVVIRYAKNLNEIACEENWDEVVTKLLPVGKDGILLNEVDPDADIYVTSETQYDLPYTKTVSFSQSEITTDDYKDDQGNVDEAAYKAALVADLLAKATAYVASHSVPKVNYTLRASVERLTDVGDTIEVIDERLGIKITTNVIAYEWDVLTKRYTSLEFGNFTNKLSGLVPSMTAETDNIVTEKTDALQVTLGQEIAEANAKLRDFLGNSYVIYEGDRILVVDRLPAEAHTGNVIQINSQGIGFSQTGTQGVFRSAWTIDNVLNMENINVINLTADLIKGGTLKLGSRLNQSGVVELYDEDNAKFGEITKDGLKFYGADGSYVLMNNDVGFAGYDKNDQKIYWVDQDEFHQKKSYVEEVITICQKIRFIPVTRYDAGGNIVNDGVAVVASGIGSVN